MRVLDFNDNFTTASAPTAGAGSFTTGVFTGAVIMSSTVAVTGNFAVNTDKFTVAASTGNTLIAGTGSVTGDFAVATNKFTVASASGNTLVAGTLNITGIVTPAALLDISGASAGQIKFPGTQNASSNVNTLDDYEEGTWTPTLNSWTNVGSPTFTGTTYTKIGRLVFITVVITPATSISATLITSTITGLPFAPAQLSVGSMANSGTGAAIGEVIVSTASSGTIYPQTTGVLSSQIAFSASYIAAT